MVKTRQWTCYRCRRRVNYDEAMQWMMFRVLCTDCVNSGYRLERWTPDSFQHIGRKWHVDIMYGGHWVT